MKKLAKALMILAIGLLAGCGKGGTEEMVITGGQEYVYAPQPGETTQVAAYVVMVGEGEKAEVLENVSWSILSSSEGATIDENGVVTITDKYIYGDINGTDIIIQAASHKNPENTATVTLHVREAKRLVSFELSLPNSIQKGEKVDVALVNCKDQYGEPMDAPAFDAVRWEFSNQSLSMEGGQLWNRIRTQEPMFAAVSATISGFTAEARFVAHNTDGYQPDAATLEELEKATIKILREVDFSQPRQLDKGQYVYINENVAGLKELVVDVKELVNYSATTPYQVTIRQVDGAVLAEEKLPEADGTVKISLTNAEAVEVSPVLQFSLGNCELSAEDGYVQVPFNEKYTGQEICGFHDTVAETMGGVSLCGEQGMFVVALPDGFYSVKITKPKSGNGRSSVYINGASQGTNVGNGGTGGRKGVSPYTYVMPDVWVEGSTLRLSLGEKDFTLAAVEIRKTPEITERKVHIYIGGDSTVSNYYPIEESEPAPGRFQTGWGQVFAQYVDEENAVTNMAGGGTFAKSWYEMAFPGVVQNGQPGDYFIIHAGINDRTYSSTDEMVQYLTKMIEECQAKGIIPILTTAMQTPKFWKDAHGAELGEYGTPEGSGLAAFMDAIRGLAAEKKVFLVDVGKLTGEWYGKVGRTYVAQNYHIYNSETNTEEDTLHLSYHGALKVAEIVATELARQQAAGVTDGQGNTLEGLSFNDVVTYEVTHKDSTGAEVQTSVTAVQAIYERYGE